MTTLPPLFDIQRLLPHIERDELILTPNNRLRSKILQAWGSYKQGQKESVWRAPRIEVLDQWFKLQWEELQSQGHLTTAQIIISSDQQLLVWESITDQCGLMQASAVAKQAASAYNTLIRWNQSLESANQHVTQWGSLNPQLIEWIKRYERTVEVLGYTSHERVCQIVGNAFQDNLLAKEHTIALLGFDDLAPLYSEQLSHTCDQLITLPISTHQAKTLQRIASETPQQEMQLAAQWAHQIIEEQAEARIGIIVPNLGQCRDQVEWAFIETFEAHSVHPDTERYTYPFNISAGTPLGDTPLISSTLLLLNLQQAEHDIGTIVQCLLSPFWGSYDQQLTHRTILANKLESLGVFTITHKDLCYWAERLQEKALSKEVSGSELDPSLDYQTSAATISQLLNDFYQVIANTRKPSKNTSTSHIRQLPSDWVDTFLQQLEVLQWPGERTPDSQEYQQTQMWYDLLETFASLDKVLGKINFHKALQQLQVMAKRTPFQPKVPDSPIQILGILEGASLHFTHTWIMGLHQHAWPPAAAPNSLLPINMQRELNMPHASSLRELHYAQSLTENYRHCANHIIFSSPQNEDDSEKHLLPSQLIVDIPLSDTAAIVDQAEKKRSALEQWQQTIQKSAQLEWIDCSQGPAFTQAVLSGGATLFKVQAENPFDSFARYRLGAKEPIAPMNGFSHIERGNILHYSLASIWQQLKEQSALLEMTEEQLNNLVEQSVHSAIADIRKHKLKHLNPTLVSIEQERQHALILQWLEYEKTRTPFSVVSIEEEQKIQFAPKSSPHSTLEDSYELTIRIDRVDQLQDGSYLIIDYKTGETNVNAWKGERPKEPQLPLYALCYKSDTGAPIKGISFAQINIKDQTFHGLAEANLSTGIYAIENNKISLPKTWEETLEHWQDTLDTLLKQFINGDCSIDYVDAVTQSYAGNFIRINRLHETESIQQWLKNSEVKKQNISKTPATTPAGNHQ